MKVLKRIKNGNAAVAIGVIVGASALVGYTAGASARAVPDSVKVACSSDYNRFCPRYKVGTSKLNRCMRSNGKRLSRVCVRALIDHGMVPRSLLRKARQRR
jgi:hypothetical protein